jgi:hypothetical protein
MDDFCRSIASSPGASATSPTSLNDDLSNHGIAGEGALKINSLLPVLLQISKTPGEISNRNEYQESSCR